MIENEKPADPPEAREKPALTAAGKALLERRVLGAGTLVHGAYYNGLFGDMTMIARWHAHKHRFVLSEQAMGGPKLQAAPHVAEATEGVPFAPLAEQQAEGDYHISDFAFETTG